MLMVNTVNATIQANVPDVLRGRVMALYVMFFAGTTPIGGIFAGAVAEVWGVPMTLALGGAIALAAAILVAWRFRLAGIAGALGQTHLVTVGREAAADVATRGEATPT
jgi:hypothetical protein